MKAWVIRKERQYWQEPRSLHLVLRSTLSVSGQDFSRVYWVNPGKAWSHLLCRSVDIPELSGPPPRILVLSQRSISMSGVRILFSFFFCFTEYTSKHGNFVSLDALLTLGTVEALRIPSSQNTHHPVTLVSLDCKGARFSGEISRLPFECTKKTGPMWKKKQPLFPQEIRSSEIWASSFVLALSFGWRFS